jgi:hypothetical protein
MIVLAEGLQHQSEAVRDSCIQFLTPTILDHQSDLAHLLNLINCKRAFTNQYFDHVPCLIVNVVIKVLPDDTTLPKYLRDTVKPKIEQAEVSFEEMLLFRLTADIGKADRDTRSLEFTEILQSLTPDFEAYRAIFISLCHMREPDQAFCLGFTRRAVLGEWIKFSVHLELQDVVVRSQMVSLIFEMASNLEASFNDYEYLLGE